MEAKKLDKVDALMNRIFEGTVGLRKTTKSHFKAAENIFYQRLIVHSH